MKQPLGFSSSTYSDHVCLLKKSLYGLKQALRAWFDKLSKSLIQLGFKCSVADPSLFFYRTSSQILILLMYVDDVLLTGSSSSLMSQLIKRLNKKFSLKDLGQLSYFLGIEVTHFTDGLFFLRQIYTKDLITMPICLL